MKALSKISKPIVVVDWGWLRGRPAGNEQLPNRAVYVLADTVFVEAITTEKQSAMLAKLRRVVVSNVGRLYVGRYWQDISAVEDPESPASIDDIVHMELTAGLPTLAEESNGDWRERLIGLRDVIDEDTKWRQSFVEWCEMWTEWAASHAKNHLRRSQSDSEYLLGWIRSPTEFVDLILNRNDRFRGSDPWRQALSTFPDTHAVGKWMRLVSWFAIQHSLGHTSKFENNWDDARYAFLSSYTGWIATNDHRLRQAVNAVFPRVQIWMQCS